MNEHKKINELLTDFALGELSQEQASAVRTHLSGCPECSSEIKRLKALLECTERIRESSVDEQTCQSAKQAILQTVESQKIKQQTSGPNVSLEYIRNTILKSPITKIAAAAVIIIAAALILHNGSVDITTPAFGVQDVLVAMKKAEWMHIKYEIIELHPEHVASGEIIRPPETWISVNPHRMIQIFDNGNMSFREDELGKETRYNPESNKITITYKSRASDVQPSSIENLLFNQISDGKKRRKSDLY